MKVISNSSPLIGLSSIRKLDILKVVWGSVIIPEAVFHEVVILGENKTGSKEVKAACQDWLEVISIQSRQEVEALQTILDLGESEVITLGQELGADLLLINNREPRRVARSLNFDVLGTLGIIKLAWKKGIIDDPLNLINELRTKGFWVHTKLVERIRDEVKGLE